MKPDCPVKDGPMVKKETGNPALKPKSTPKGTTAAAPTGKKAAACDNQVGDPKVKDVVKETVIPDVKADGVKELISEAASLLKSLRAPSVKMAQVRSLEGDHSRTLLDGGATHILRQTSSPEEFQSAIPTVVELASGSITLRQLPTGTLLTDFPTQTIIPLGKLVAAGYHVQWDSEGFCLRDRGGAQINVKLEANCPTVTNEVGKELIKILESKEKEVQERIRALKANEPGTLKPKIWRWISDFKRRFPEVPDEIVARVIPSGVWSGDEVP